MRKEIRHNRENLNRKKKKEKGKKVLSAAVLTGSTATLLLGSILPAHAVPGESSDSISDQGRATSSFTISPVSSEANEEKEAEESNDDPAEETGDTENTDTEDQESVNRQVEENEEASKADEEEVSYESYIMIVSSDSIETITVREEEENAYRALLYRGADTTGYRDESGDRITEDDLKKTDLANRSTLVLNTTDRTIESEEVELDYRTEEVETDDLLEGETEVEQEGIDGSAVNFEITYSNGEHQTSEERFEVTKAPVSEIILVGTREPEPEPELEEVSTSDTSDTPDDVQYGDNTVRSSDVDESDVDYDEDVGNAVVNTMLEHVGTRYVWAGTSPSEGFDCSGIINWAYAQEGIDVPRTAASLGAASTNVGWENIETGDIVWNDGHIGVYFETDDGQGMMVHAANPSRGVVVDPISYYQNGEFEVGRL